MIFFHTIALFILSQYIHGLNETISRNETLPVTEHPLTIIGGSGEEDFSDSDEQNGEFCTCGSPQAQTRVIGGRHAIPNEFPWRCYLRAGNSRGPGCGCTLISNEWVMTAAHCTLGAKPLHVVLGAHDTRKRAQDQTISVQENAITRHPLYKHSLITPAHDIALIRLPHPANTTSTVSPICLPWKYADDDFSGSLAVASGWGKYTYQHNRMAFILQKVNMSVVSQQQCRRSHGNLIQSNNLCAQGRNRGTCRGDSGVSLDLKRDGRSYAIGITSWGDSCRYRKPVVFARVTSFLDWIQQVTNANFCKI